MRELIFVFSLFCAFFITTNLFVLFSKMFYGIHFLFSRMKFSAAMNLGTTSRESIPLSPRGSTTSESTVRGTAIPQQDVQGLTMPDSTGSVNDLGPDAEVVPLAPIKLKHTKTLQLLKMDGTSKSNIVPPDLSLEEPRLPNWSTAGPKVIERLKAVSQKPHLSIEYHQLIKANKHKLVSIYGYISYNI